MKVTPLVFFLCLSLVSAQKLEKYKLSKHFLKQFNFEKNNLRFNCPEPNGLFEHENCYQFWQCLNGTANQMSCPDGYYWNTGIPACDSPKVVNCSSRVTSTTSTTTTTSTKTDPEEEEEVTKDPQEEVTTEEEEEEVATEEEEEVTTEEEVITTTESTTTAVESTTTRKPTFVCLESNGYYAHEDCSKFWQCSNGTPYEFECPKNTAWNQSKERCDYSNDCPNQYNH